jgi:hypothetical protein
MRESRTYGSVRGARGNSRPYRDVAISGASLPIRGIPDVAEFIIGPAEGRTRWLIWATS